MAPKSQPMPPGKLADLISDFFGEEVRKISRPGGANRPVYRVWLPERCIIASFRSDPAVAEKERIILSRLGRNCRHVPRYLGSTRGFTFQQDAGQERLSFRIHTLDGERRTHLARTAYAALFDIQHKAADTGLTDRLHPIDMDPADILHFARGPDRLARRIAAASPDSDWAEISARLAPTRLRFTKSDCRAGNAALDDGGTLRWFDFELSGLRHGAEDMGWLTADETWPVDIETCCSLVEELAIKHEGASHVAFMDMFRLWTVLQMSRRLRLILTEAQKSGWVPTNRVLRYDFVGTDPHLGARLAQKAAWLSAQTPATRAWTPVFARTAEVFARVTGT